MSHMVSSKILERLSKMNSNQYRELEAKVKELELELAYMTDTNITCARNGAHFAHENGKLENKVKELEKELAYTKDELRVTQQYLEDKE